MINAIKKEVTVQSGGLIEIRSPELKAGMRAEVIVILEEARQPQRRLLRNIIGTGKGSFSSPEEADAFIRRERDAWE